MSEKIRVDLNRRKCAKVKAAGAPQLTENTGAGHRWTRFIIARRLPDPAVRESGLDVRTFCYRRQGLRQPIKLPVSDEVVLHHISMRW